MEDISVGSELMSHQVSLCGKWEVFRTFLYILFSFIWS